MASFLEPNPSIKVGQRVQSKGKNIFWHEQSMGGTEAMALIPEPCPASLDFAGDFCELVPMSLSK